MSAKDLQCQLTKLMAQVKEERRLHQTAEAARKQEANARIQAEAKAGLPTAATASKGPKVAVPDKFNGTHGIKAEFYANQVGLYVVSNLTLFLDDCSRLVFLLSYLTGAASAWAQPFTVKVFNGVEVT
jgi:hypothetical protein